MDTPARLTFISRSPAATLSLGRRLGQRLRAGSVIALTGELGCGKTLLTRGICEGLGVPPRQVNSPTFVLVNEYRGRLPVWHLDLYRLGGEADAVELGISDYLARAGAGVMVVEWAEKIPSLLPEERLDVAFVVISERQRRLDITASGERFAGILEGLDKS
jgi:tRNA threonylcarbamoyladenosine biosynthesis protein TsaE